jgi:hypothetical protein
VSTSPGSLLSPLGPSWPELIPSCSLRLLEACADMLQRPTAGRIQCAAVQHCWAMIRGRLLQRPMAC